MRNHWQTDDYPKTRLCEMDGKPTDTLEKEVVYEQTR